MDGSSRIFGMIASIIESFEDRSRMVVYQSANQRLNLLLPRHKMTFTVNDNGLLESSELRAVVSSNQDIGTLYGLQTKLVLEDVANQRERSILVPRGAVRIAKRSNHVQVDIDTPGEVAVSCCRFSLNAFLRRLDCRAELRDVYYKAYLHAITSFVLPDPFTGRTGTEMALDCLKSGLAQLTVPLDSESIKTLVALACLTPRRLYYPSHLQVMQTVEWSPALSAAAQHDDFNIAVNTIFARSALYLPFHTDLKTHIEPLLSRGNSHLLLRARSRHSTYRNAQCTFSLPKSVQDTRYTPRDKNRGSEGSLRVFEIASLVRQWSSNIDVAQNLCERFSLWNRISGYGNPFRETSLDKILHLDFAELWGSLFQMCQRSVQFKDTFKLMFLFSTISFGNNVDMPMLRTLMAVAFVPSIRAMKVPQWSSYVGFRDGEVPTEAELQVLMQATFVISRNTRKKPIAERLAAQVRFRAKCTATKDFAQFLIRQWPCLEPSRTGYGDSNLISIDAALNAVKAEWSRLFVNSRLAEHLRELQEYLKDCQARTFFRPVSIAVPIEVVHPALGSVEAAPSLRNLLRRMIRGPLLRKCAQVLSGTESERSEQNYDDNGSEAWQLRSIVTRIKSDPNQIRSRYGNDLWQSLNALKIAANSMEHKPRVIDIESTLHAIQVLEKNVQKHFEVLVVSLQHSNDFEWLSLGDQWPRTTPTTLLESLRKCVPDILSGVALEAVVEYGESITQLQRAVRIEKALRMNNLVQLNEELLNEGHADWKPKSYPEWLLIEIEANVLIRPEQYNVAVEMISPASGQSTLIQLNMGKGKSSLIIPMIASELADSHRILRIIVPKPLLAQETQVLASRLCGLLGRPLSHIPFSRKTPTDSATISAYWKIHEKSRERRGVIIALPEHILSFKLSGLERMSCGKLEEAVLMLQTQTLLSRNCRDVLDESDHILAVRTQLIYPSGTPIMVDGHPHRWVTSQELLYLVQQHLENLREQYPNGLEVIARSGGGYPTVHILRKDVEDRLLHLLTKDICEGRTPILPLHKFQAKDLQQIERFVSDSQYMESEGKILLSRMEELLGEDSITKDMLLLRGLLVHRILLLALNKRWNVQYGLDLTRCLMTVPYHAKGIPSANAEFGHPDVAILLTCLSYYNTGLSEDQLRQSLAKVLSMDDPAFEYDQWVLCSAMVPISLRDWHAINLEDEEQVTVLWRCLSHAVKTVNFYMNHFVFPKEARAYQKKLVTNSWDIPLWSEGVGGLSGQDLHIPHQIISQELGITTRGNLALTTGFSGTNDNRSLLPLSIKQRDLPSLLHTNAEVLLYLLQQRNRSYICAVNEQGQRLPVENFLRLITKQSPAINVVLDAGAQVLEMNNYDVVELWLRIETNAEAAVFFSKDDKIMVLYRDGRQESLAASPFVDDLKNCLVYLDESHTRGTDLKLPATSRAALTLGPGQTKDHTVQGKSTHAYTQCLI